MAATATETKTTTAKAEPVKSAGTALAKPAEARITGAYHDAALADERLRQASGKAHLVSPATVVGSLPPGCAIAIAMVEVDAKRETYSTGGGKLGLSKSALDRIAAAAGISWDPHLSRRLDDGSNPHYVAWQAVGSYRRFDGTECQLIGNKELDLRDGSQAARTLKATQLGEMRLHIVGHAETKARLRAIRSLGIRTSYEADELSKPFVVARLMWTGQSEDPELRRAFAMKQADAMLGGVRSLYGGGATEPTPLRPMLPAPYAPPPVAVSRSARRSSDDAMPDFDDVPETPAGTIDARDDEAPSSDGKPVLFRFGKDIKGKPITEGSDRDLEWYGEALATNAADPEKSRYRSTNERELAAVRAEQARRAKAPKAEAKAPDVANGEVDESRLPPARDDDPQRRMY